MSPKFPSVPNSPQSPPGIPKAMTSVRSRTQRGGCIEPHEEPGTVERDECGPTATPRQWVELNHHPPPKTTDAECDPDSVPVVAVRPASELASKIVELQRRERQGIMLTAGEGYAVPLTQRLESSLLRRLGRLPIECGLESSIQPSKQYSGLGCRGHGGRIK